MSKLTAQSNVKMAAVQAVIIRADGTRVPLGTVAYYHRNPLRRLIYRITQRLRRP